MAAALSLDYVFHKTDSISKFYNIGQQLGQPGQFGIAKLCTHKATYGFCRCYDCYYIDNIIVSVV